MPSRPAEAASPRRAFLPGGLIRRAELSDFPALADLYLAVRCSTFAWLPASLFQREDFFRDTQGECVWVAVRNRRIVGFASVYLESAFLHSLYVAEDAQGNGVGKALLDHVIQTTPGRITLKCLTFNRAAQAFYRARGWAIVGGGESAHGPYVTFEAPA